MPVGLDVHRAILDRCYELSKNSSCAKRHSGSIVARGAGVIVGEGWNHSPNPAFLDCATLCVGGIRKGIPSGTRVELCHAGHAEGWAITDAGVLARGGRIYVTGTDAVGNRYLKDPKLPVGHPDHGFYCTLCIRHIWMAGILEIWVDGVDGPVVETLDEAWASSYARAATGIQ